MKAIMSFVPQKTQRILAGEGRDLRSFHIQNLFSLQSEGINRFYEYKYPRRFFHPPI